VGAGSANITSTFTDNVPKWSDADHTCLDNWVTRTGSSTCDVQVPKSLSVLTPVQLVSLNLVPPCTTSDYGIFIAIHYQVLDQNTAAIHGSTMTPQEKVLSLVLNGVPQGDPEPNWHNIAPNLYQPTAYTDSNGQFWDAAVGSCASVAFNSTYSQPIQILAHGIGYPVRTNSWSEASASPNHGSITNNKDISATH